MSRMLGEDDMMAMQLGLQLGRSAGTALWRIVSPFALLLYKFDLGRSRVVLNVVFLAGSPISRG